MTCISEMVVTVDAKYAAVDRVSKYLIHFNCRIAINASNATNGLLRLHFQLKWLNLLVNTSNLPVLPFHGPDIVLFKLSKISWWNYKFYNSVY